MEQNLQDNNLQLNNPELIPSTDDKRDVSDKTFFIMCIGFYVQLVSFISGAQMFPTLSPLTILICVTIGNLVVSCFNRRYRTEIWNSVFCVYASSVWISRGLFPRSCPGNPGSLLVWLSNLDGK